LGAGDHLDQARLAGAVVAADRQHLAAKHVEVDLAHRRDRAIALADPAQRQDRRGGTAHLRNCFTFSLSTSTASVNRYGPLVMESFGCFFTTIASTASTACLPICSNGIDTVARKVESGSAMRA